MKEPVEEHSTSETTEGIGDQLLEQLPPGDGRTSHIPTAPPPEVLDALDRAAGVLDELERRAIELTLHHDEAARAVDVTVGRAGGDPRQLSHRALLNLLDGDPLYLEAAVAASTGARSL
jgi:hypothetical protein